ncbi:hypothetical protein IT408_02370 [Candidatus Uhrbacteria bacterium]|nr:hypothetical protein [Candidatus Uhrbacteria bacterium]
MKHSSLFVRSLTGLSLASFLLPISASASTTQQLLNQAIKTQFESTIPMTMSGSMTVTSKSVLFKGNVQQNDGAASFHLMYRTLAPVSDQKFPDSEGQFIIDKAYLHDSKKTQQIDITKPIGLEWKMVHDALYFRGKDLPIEWTQELPEELKQYINQWLKLSTLNNSENPESNSLGVIQPLDLLQSSLGGSILSAEKDVKTRLKALPWFLVTRTEKKTVIDGKTILRLRVVLNPAIITLLQNEEYKSLKGMSASARREETTRINKKYIEIRTALRSFFAVMELNTTDQYVRRFEMSAKITEPVNDCTWNDRLSKTICKQTGRSTVTLVGGFNFAPKNDQPAIVIPTTSIDLMQLFNSYMKNSLGSSDVESPEAVEDPTPDEAAPAM